jgi:hypothetical protein
MVDEDSAHHLGAEREAGAFRGHARQAPRPGKAVPAEMLVEHDEPGQHPTSPETLATSNGPQGRRRSCLRAWRIKSECDTLDVRGRSGPAPSALEVRHALSIQLRWRPNRSTKPQLLPFRRSRTVVGPMQLRREPSSRCRCGSPRLLIGSPFSRFVPGATASRSAPTRRGRSDD